MENNSNSRKIELFVPGRLCLFGEHSDWAGLNRAMNAEVMPGHAIVTGIEQGIYATAYKSDKFSVIDNVSGERENSFTCEMNRDKLKEAAKQGGYYSYVCGVASYICEWYRISGITVEIYKRTIPMKSGLSSSAAICVLVAEAFNRLYELHLNTEGIMNMAYWGEQRTPSRCGRLDQACAYGVNPVSMIFDGQDIESERITLKAPLYYVFADLMASKDTVKILRDLNRAYPFASNEKEERLHEALGSDNLDITERAINYINSGDAEGLGVLMTEAQKLFDEKVAPMCPEELAAPVLHAALNDAKIKELTFGGKGVGSQGDGTVQFLARDEESQKKLADYLNDVKGMKAYKLTLKPNSAVRRAIIPVAGFGTRLYPATRGIKKEFCPVVDKDGLVKPVILVLIEELINSGIEDICLIINPDEEAFYEGYFKKPISPAHYDSLPEQMKQYEDRLQRLSDKITFVQQKEQKGFGHAVFQAREFTDGEPVLLLLGDTIYMSNTDVTCTKQFIDAYDTYGTSMCAVHEVPLDEVQSYGIFAGSYEDAEKKLIKLDRIKEKPTPDYAADYLGMPGRAYDKETYYAAFGLYILREDVFEELSGMCAESEASLSGAEVQLTGALERVMQKNGMMAFIPDGRSFDIGNAAAYRETFREFGM